MVGQNTPMPGSRKWIFIGRRFPAISSRSLPRPSGIAGVLLAYVASGKVRPGWRKRQTRPAFAVGCPPGT